MDQHAKWVRDKRIEALIDNLKMNNMNGYQARSYQELIDLLDQLIGDKETVSVGGSMTLFETGVIGYLRARDLIFLDRYQEGLTADNIEDIYFNAFNADVYLTSTNALTQEGGLYNVDGRGNRVAAMIYGPKKVIVVVGANKIVQDLDAAIERNRLVAAPANARRLNRKTPCASLGYCTDCHSPDKICHAYTYISSQMNKDRMHVIILDDSYGY